MPTEYATLNGNLVEEYRSSTSFAQAWEASVQTNRKTGLRALHAKVLDIADEAEAVVFIADRYSRQACSSDGSEELLR